jgi:plasmid maintenance system antidote protein VapI
MQSLKGEIAAALVSLEGSQRAIARQSEISATLLNYIVRGKRRATPDVARRIAKALEYWSREYHLAAQRIRRAARQPKRRAK